MIIQRWVQRMKCYFVARCMNYRRSKTLSIDTYISPSITTGSFLGLKAPTAMFLEAAKSDIFRQLMSLLFLCNIFPRLHGLKGSSVMCSDVEPDFSGKQNVDWLNFNYHAVQPGPQANPYLYRSQPLNPWTQKLLWWDHSVVASRPEMKHFP